MGSIWYVCKFCQRALTSSHQLKVHKLANHLPQLLRLKEEKKAAAELLLQTQSRQKTESGTIRNETLDLEETGPPEPSYINASQKKHIGSKCSDIGIKTSDLPVGLEPNLDFESLNSISSRYVKADQNPNPASHPPANTYPEKNCAETNNGTERASDANDAIPAQTRIDLADVKIEVESDSTDSLSSNEFQAVSQHLNLIGSEPVTPEEVESISIEDEVSDQLRPVRNIPNTPKADQKTTDLIHTPLAYVDYLFRKYQLQEHFYRDHGRLTLTCSYCPSGLRYRYFKWALNHVLLHTETLESKNCLEKLRECSREYTKGPPKVTSARIPALHSKKDEGSFRCPHCGKRFSRKFGLRFHLKNHHSASACSSTNPRTTKTKKLTTNTQRPLVSPAIQAFGRVPVIMEHVSPKNLAQARVAGDAGSTSRSAVQPKAYPKRRKQTDPAPSTKKGNFVCPTCKRFFKRKMDLSVHLEEHRKKSSRFYCRQCEATFETVSEQSRHRRLEHKPHEEPTKCTFCDKGFANRSALERHTMEVHTSKSHDCEYCGKSFSTHWALGYHLKMHLQKDFMIRRVTQRKITFACQSPGCPEVLDTADLLDMHFKCTHIFACHSPGCQKVFDKANMLELHFKYMHANHKHPSTNIIAENAGPTVLIPSAAVRTIEPPQPPTGVIEIAKPVKESSSAAVIPYRQRHWKKAVLGRKDLSSNLNHCSECDLSFKNAFELEIHVQSHTGFAIQLAYCTFCGKMFSTARCLELHIEQHSDGLLPCACQQCHQVYSSVSNFNCHMLTAHKRQEA